MSVAGIVAPTAGLPAAPKARFVSLQGVDHHRQGGIGRSWTVACLACDSQFGIQHGMIQIEEGGMAALAVRVDPLLLAQRGIRTRMRAHRPGCKDGAVTGATSHATDGRETIPSDLWPRQGTLGENARMIGSNLASPAGERSGIVYCCGPNGDNKYHARSKRQRESCHSSHSAVRTHGAIAVEKPSLTVGERSSLRWGHKAQR